MKINAALDAIQFNAAFPVAEHRGHLYLISVDGRDTGHVYYTKFEMDLKTPVHSVQMPYSSAHTLGEVLDRGEGLQQKIPPITTLLPPETYAIIEVKVQPIIKFY